MNDEEIEKSARELAHQIWDDSAVEEEELPRIVNAFKAFSSSFNNKIKELEQQLEQQSHSADLFMIGESKAERERDEARAELARAKELLRGVEAQCTLSGEVENSWLLAISEFNEKKTEAL